MISFRTLLLALVGAAYLGISYVATTLPHPPLITILVGFIPLGAAALAAAWQSRARGLLIAAYAAGALLIAFNLDTLRNHAAWLYFIQHAGAMILLGVTFGSTLGRRHADALCSRIALFILPQPLDAGYLLYTWKVTLAWTVFFAASAALSVGLFFFASIKAWSVFADLLTPILIGLMFAGEYLVRVRVVPDGPRLSIAATIKAYRAFSQRPNTP